MNDWNITPRYWSPDQRYATGNVLITLLSEGWRLIGSSAVRSEGRALLHACTLAKGEAILALYVLDCPAVRALLSTKTTPYTHPA